jgi:hypothetical protein
VLPVFPETEMGRNTFDRTKQPRLDEMPWVLSNHSTSFAASGRFRGQ